MPIWMRTAGRPSKPHRGNLVIAKCESFHAARAVLLPAPVGQLISSELYTRCSTRPGIFLELEQLAKLSEYHGLQTTAAFSEPLTGAPCPAISRRHHSLSCLAIPLARIGFTAGPRWERERPTCPPRIVPRNDQPRWVFGVHEATARGTGTAAQCTATG